MGCDGGTIPTRDELVKLKKKPEQKDRDTVLAVKWKHCTITQEPLQQPIMACELGRLYNKDSVIEFLLDKPKFDSFDNFDHLRGLKDIKALVLTENAAYKKTGAEKGDAYIDTQAAEYICPITGLEMSGRYKFCYLLGCGCVFAERALKEVKSETCHKCGKSYVAEDVIVLNGSEEEVTSLKTRMESRRLAAKLEKKAKKKHKIEAALGAPPADEPASKQPRLEADAPSTSTGAATTSKLTNHSKERRSKLANGRSASSKLANGKADDKKKPKGIQEDPTASKIYKSLFNTHERALNQQRGHWVTFNPHFN